MQDIYAKMDRAKALIEPALDPESDERTPAQTTADATELMMLGVELIGSLLVDLNRIANAVEAMKPPQITLNTLTRGDDE